MIDNRAIWRGCGVDAVFQLISLKITFEVLPLASLRNGLVVCEKYLSAEVNSLLILLSFWNSESQYCIVTLHPSIFNNAVTPLIGNKN